MASFAYSALSGGGIATVAVLMGWKSRKSEPSCKKTALLALVARFGAWLWAVVKAPQRKRK